MALPSFLLCVILAAALLGEGHACGTPPFEPQTGNRVVNGEDAKPNSWPWQVSLQYNREGEWRHTCGGTLISNQWVLTAAHCIEAREYRVALGKHNLVEDEADAVFLSPAHIIVHENWNPRNMMNDIALIKLSQPVTFSDAIMAACLPEAGFLLPHDEPCYITGWGRLSTGGPIADNLQQALCPAVDHATASLLDWWGPRIKATNVACGGDGVIGGCNGDSGGPMMCRNPDGAWEVHGAMSFGLQVSCNFPKKPTVFTQVSSYMDWINSKMVSK